MFRKLLVANRGEIACRIIRTARRLGIGTVAVYSDADRDALHVAMADEAVHIGAAPAKESYLRADRIVEACHRTGAEAIHPGYGFLSENADFSRKCKEEGLTFVGPPAAAIEAMGSKSAAKAIMGDAGVPLVPGYHEADQSPERLRRAAAELGYPVLLKAVAGGGGKGMRLVEDPNDVVRACEGASREASGAFGNGTVSGSGVGKSTLLHLIGLLDRADRGRMVIDGVAASSKIVITSPTLTVSSRSMSCVVGRWIPAMVRGMVYAESVCRRSPRKVASAAPRMRGRTSP